MHKNSNRVLNREGARELTQKEIENVSAGQEFRTTTMCSFDPKTQQADGDVGEC